MYKSKNKNTNTSANFVTKSSFLIKKIIQKITDDLLISVGKY